jgi:hypothetical protein
VRKRDLWAKNMRQNEVLLGTPLGTVREREEHHGELIRNLRKIIENMYLNRLRT